MHRRRPSPLRLIVSGCATYADRLAEVHAVFVTGDLAAGRRRRSTAASRGVAIATCSRSIGPMLELCAGQPREAEQTLRTVRDEFDARENALLQGKALSMLTDAEAENYHGEDYEKVLIRAFLCLSNLMGDGGDAQAYAYQVAEKQQQIIDAGTDAEGTNPKLAYRRVALGAVPATPRSASKRTPTSTTSNARTPSSAVGSPTFPTARKTWSGPGTAPIRRRATACCTSSRSSASARTKKRRSRSRRPCRC